MLIWLENLLSASGRVRTHSTMALTRPALTQLIVGRARFGEGVADIFGNSDVYAASPPPDAKILVRGQVLAGMEPTSPPVQGPKNNPMQPVAWTRFYKNEAGNTN